MRFLLRRNDKLLRKKSPLTQLRINGFRISNFLIECIKTISYFKRVINSKIDLAI